MQRTLRRGLSVLGLTALWLLLAGRWSVPEFLAGLVAALLATAIAGRTQAAGPSRFKLRWLLRAPAAAATVFTGSFTVMAAIARGLIGRPPVGRFVTVAAPEQPSGPDDARVGAQALSLTLGPNSLVADVPNGARGYVVHQLVRKAPPVLEPLP